MTNIVLAQRHILLCRNMFYFYFSFTTTFTLYFFLYIWYVRQFCIIHLLKITMLQCVTCTLRTLHRVKCIHISTICKRCMLTCLQKWHSSIFSNHFIYISIAIAINNTMNVCNFFLQILVCFSVFVVLLLLLFHNINNIIIFITYILCCINDIRHHCLLFTLSGNIGTLHRAIVVHHHQMCGLWHLRNNR